MVGGFNPPEKYESQLGCFFPRYGKKNMFQTTRHHDLNGNSRIRWRVCSPLCPVAPVIDFVFPVITTYNSLIYIIYIAIRCWLVVLSNSENMNVNWDHEMTTYYVKIKIKVLF